MLKPTFDIYVDGACSGNPGPGGYAAILIHSQSKQERIIAGYHEYTTNNHMELKAVISALQSLKRLSVVNVYTDSSYVFINGQKEQMQNHKFRHKKKVSNRDLWESLYFYHKIHDITFYKVKAHAENAYNNRCDSIAKEEIKKNKRLKKKNEDWITKQTLNLSA